MKHIEVTDHIDARGDRLIFDHLPSPNRVRVTIRYGAAGNGSSQLLFLTPAQIESLAKILPKLDGSVSGTTCVGPGIAVV